jgi:hypothetical protein
MVAILVTPAYWACMFFGLLAITGTAGTIAALIHRDINHPDD